MSINDAPGAARCANRHPATAPRLTPSVGLCGFSAVIRNSFTEIGIKLVFLFVFCGKHERKYKQ
jgi:hypothetical protein